MNIPEEAIAAFRNGWRARTEYDEFIPDDAIWAGLGAAAPLIAAQERERVAAFIDRAVARKRETAAMGFSADTIVADAWEEAAGWLREASIWENGRECSPTRRECIHCDSWARPGSPTCGECPDSLAGALSHWGRPVKPCNDCGAAVGAEHEDGCDVARCLAYGTQRIQCGDGARLVLHGFEVGGGPIFGYQIDGHDCGRDVWSGRWPGEAECEEFGWWAVFVPNGNPSWKPVPPGTFDAVPNLNRLQIEARWDAARRRWVLPESTAAQQRERSEPS